MQEDLTTYSWTRLESADAAEFGDGTGEPSVRLLAIRAEIVRRLAEYEKAINRKGN